MLSMITVVAASESSRGGCARPAGSVLADGGVNCGGYHEFFGSDTPRLAPCDFCRTLGRWTAAPGPRDLPEK